MTTILESADTGYVRQGRYAAFIPDPLENNTAEPMAPYWTWRRLSMFVQAVRGGRVPTPGEWQALQREIPSLSTAKRTWLYHQLQGLFSLEALHYLFNGWRPAATVIPLDQWL